MGLELTCKVDLHLGLLKVLIYAIQLSLPALAVATSTTCVRTPTPRRDTWLHLQYNAQVCEAGL